MEFPTVKKYDSVPFDGKAEDLREYSAERSRLRPQFFDIEIIEWPPTPVRNYSTSQKGISVKMNTGTYQPRQ